MSRIPTARTALAGALTWLLAAACGGGGAPSPAAPSGPSPVSALSNAVAIGRPAAAPLFGTGAADLASCLGGSGDSACFSGARLSGRAVGVAATAADAPSALTATAAGSTVTLTWRAPTGTQPASSYVIEAGSSSGASNLANLVTNSTATTFSTSGVPSGTYYVRVRAQYAAGLSDASNESILTVGTSACTSAPNVPSGLASAISGSTVTFTWSAPSGGCVPASYVLQAGSAADTSNLANFNTGSTATSYAATGVAAGTYYVRVAAANGIGQSGPSNEIVVTVGSPGQNVSGRWIGVAPDGVTFNVPAAPDTFCDDADDLQLDLTQVGTAVSGTATLRTRTARTPPACRSGDTTAGQATLANGTADGTGVSFIYEQQPRRSLIFSGVVSGNRMSGVVICGGDQSECGTFAVTRQ